MLTQQTQILLIDDDPDVLEAYRDLMSQEGYRVQALADANGVTGLIPVDWPGVVVSDVLLPGDSGLTLLDNLLQYDPSLPVLLITGHGDVPMAVDAVKRGAFDFLEKPVAAEKLLARAEAALQQRRALIERRSWQKQTLGENLLGDSQWMRDLRTRLQKLAEVDLPVMFFGEIGTGRRRAADYLHRLGERHQAPLVVQELLPDSELQLDRLLERVQGGSLVLKNIAHLPVNTQLALAQLQQSDRRSFRLIAIDEQSPAALAVAQRLVPELYYLLSLTQIEMVPLSQRIIDIPEIFCHYLLAACRRLNRRQPQLSQKFLTSLTRRPWPGNVRELANAAELYAVGLLPAQLPQGSALSLTQAQSLDERIENYERKIIEEALNLHQGRINDVATYLDVPRKKLYLRMKKYQLDKSHYKDSLYP